jgi:hypothetical protein
LLEYGGYSYFSQNIKSFSLRDQVRFFVLIRTGLMHLNIRSIYQKYKKKVRNVNGGIRFLTFLGRWFAIPPNTFVFCFGSHRTSDGSPISGSEIFPFGEFTQDVSSCPVAFPTTESFWFTTDSCDFIQLDGCFRLRIQIYGGLREMPNVFLLWVQ